MTYYISGPMSGIPELNRPAFYAAKLRLLELGHTSCNPHDIQRQQRPLYRQYLARDLAYICEKADALYMLKGWEHSPGARAEHAVAVALELRIEYEGN